MVGEPLLAVEEHKRAEPSVTESLALVRRVAASAQFARTARLRSFLLYVGQESLKAGAAEIHEQDIGMRVFERSRSYDRSQDNIVRVNATELRKRVDAYFQTDGIAEPLIFSIPRGGYRLVFAWRQTPATAEPENAVDPRDALEPAHDTGFAGAPAAVALEASVEPPGEEQAPVPMPAPSPLTVVPVALIAGRRQLAALRWLVGLAALLLVACGWLLYSNRQLRQGTGPWSREPTLAKFWTEATQAPQTDIVLPDDSLTVAEEILGRPISLSNYLDHHYIPVDAAISPERRAAVQDLFHHNLVTLGGFHAAQQFLALTPLAANLHLTLARFYAADLLQRDNVILIGGEKSNPWVHLFADQMNFHLDFSPRGDHAFITNQHPGNGERRVYEASMDSNALAGYCVVAFLPDAGRRGSAIVLAGSDSDATGAGAGFLTSEYQLREFLTRLHASSFPYFEVLLRTSRLSGASFNSEIVAYRTYPGPRAQ